MITVFTPSNADEASTNAQNLTVKEIVARLDPARFHVTLLTDKPPDPRLASRANTELVAWRRHGNTAYLLRRLVRHPPNIYFFPRYGPLDSSFILARRWLGLKSALVTYIVAALDLREDRSRPRLERDRARAIRSADVVVGNSRYVSDSIKRIEGVNARTIHSGIDRRFFFPASDLDRRLQASPQALTVLYAGSFQRRKRTDLVVTQAARWSSVRFVLAGDGEERAASEALAHRLGCTNVTCVGHLSQAALGDLMRAADVFLFPSMVEGHPQVLGQAAACGLPIVALNAYEPDYVVHECTGVLVRSADELGPALDRLLADAPLRQRMALAAVDHARQFDWDRIVKEWERVFDAAVLARAA